MSAQIAPASVDDSAAFSNGGSSSTTNGSSAPSSKKHVFSRFLKKHPPDLYGQRHAIESSKCISDSLRLLEKEINKLSESKRRGIEHARVVCPEIFESKVYLYLYQYQQHVLCSYSIVSLKYTICLS